jgi:uncharacterized protein (DUF2141 family)
MRNFFFIWGCWFAIPAFAQFTYEWHPDIKVEQHGNTLQLPWAGGLNSVQVNTLDLNGDKTEDLVLFDRTANKILTFLRVQNQYQYAPQYEEMFPAAVTQWLLLRDLNCDGKKDIFTSDPFGMVAFVNTTRPGEKLSWRPFNPGFPILTKGFTSNVNLKVNESDIPVIDDMDGDGDLDILNVRFVGIGSVEYHKNFSKERTGTCDSLQLERVTQKFGNFEECDCGRFAFGQSCADLGGGRTQHAGGKAMLAIDLDNDGDREILFSEENCPRVYMLKNEGNAEAAHMTTAVRFPEQNPIAFINFPATFYEDVDGDGRPDLMASPNLYARTLLNVDFNNSFWFYKNTGTVSLPQFSFVKSDFLQSEMIDVGDYAVPSFADADGDGDLDLFISNYANSDFRSTVRFYENTGSVASPEFKFVTDDFLSFSFANYFNVKLQFADINGDGSLDFVFTGTSRQNGITSLLFAANRSTTRFDFGGQSVQTTNFRIGTNETVLVVDVDQDGRNDLLVGKSTGAIQYWKNQAQAGAFNYVIESENFMGFGASIERQSPALAIDDLDADGKADLVMADQKGFLSIYPDFRSHIPGSEPVRNILYDPLQQKYIAKNLGGRVWPVIANLFNTDRPSIVVGNMLGGLHILKNDGGKNLPDDPVIDLFPNPVTDGSFKIKADRPVIVQFFTVLGQKISQPYFIPANQEYPIRISGLSSGIYIARFSAGSRSAGKRFMVH